MWPDRLCSDEEHDRPGGEELQEDRAGIQRRERVRTNLRKGLSVESSPCYGLRIPVRPASKRSAKCSPARPIQPADPMPVWKVAMIAADTVLGVLLAVLEIIAIKRFIDRRKKAIAE